MKHKSARFVLLLASFLLGSCQVTPSSSVSSEVSSSVEPSISYSSSEETSSEESSSEETTLETSSTEPSSEQPTSQSSEEETSSEETLSSESDVTGEPSLEPSSSEESSDYSDESSSEPSSEAPSSEYSSEEPSSESSSGEQTSEEESSSDEESSESSSESSRTSSSTPYDPFGWDVDFNEYGKTFQTTLASLINAMNPDTTSYSNCLYVGAIAAAFPEDGSSTFIPFYHAPEVSEVTTTASCNREHTWPNSRGGGSIEKDPLIIRPTLTKDNSSRGNNFYGIGSAQWDPAVCGYEGARGESARVILYAATRYANLGLSLSNNPNDSKTLKTMGTLSTLLEWNNTYRPTDFERKVNERYAKMGYARNPFVDCPDFANYIYDENGYRSTPYGGGDTPVSSSVVSSDSTVYSSESVSSEEPGEGWNLVKSVDELKAGDQVVFACNTSSVVAGPMPGAYLSPVTATFSADNKTIVSMDETAQVFTVGKTENGFTFSSESGPLGAAEVKKLAYDGGSTEWTVAISTGSATITNIDSAKGSLKYNKSSPRFTTYASGQESIQIYRAA